MTSDVIEFVLVGPNRFDSLEEESFPDTRHAKETHLQASSRIIIDYCTFRERKKMLSCLVWIDVLIFPFFLLVFHTSTT